MAVTVVAPAAFTVMLKFCVALGATPLFAVTTMPLKVPATVGVPLSRPPLVSVSPFGSVPVKLNVGAGEPVKVYWKL